jgi:hypothetical protein
MTGTVAEAATLVLFVVILLATFVVPMRTDYVEALGKLKKGHVVPFSCQARTVVLALELAVGILPVLSFSCAAGHGSPNVAIRSMPQTNKTRFSSIFGSRSA